MTPGELSTIEDTLRRAYGDVLESVRRDGSSPELMPGFQPGRPGRGFGRPGRAGSAAGWCRWLLRRPWPLSRWSAGSSCRARCGPRRPLQ